MNRPSLPRPWRRLRRGSVPATPQDGPPRRTPQEDDARLIRNTRLRLMAVSGLVTLLILVVLEGATYATVANRMESAGVDQLRAAAGIPVGQGDDTLGYSMTGPNADIGAVVMNPSGQIYRVSRNLVSPTGTIATGLPDPGGLAAVANQGDLDIRTITLPDGTPCRIMSYLPADPRFAGFKVQLVENRTREVGLLDILGKVLLGGGLLALLAALLAGYLYAGRALVPIRASIDRRQGALQRQREFAANASHELRTPLTVIAASVEDLKRNRRSKVQDVGEALGDIDAEVRHMTALVEDMLLLARTDSGVMQVDRVPVDLDDIAADATSSLAMLGQESGVSVVLDPLPAPLLGDPLRLRQLVTILVDNAIRHSPAGSTVEARVRPAAGAVTLQVDDRGPGIKPDDLPRLFERFWRADDAPAGGTGLGLAIAKWIVDQHGGNIAAVNRTDGGASFNVWLPSGYGQTTAWRPETEGGIEPAAGSEIWAAPDSSGAGAGLPQPPAQPAPPAG
jgi:signal transduction histidine kinase